MLISGLVKSSLIDYPSEIAAVVFTTGCNFRCPFCHNPVAVLPEKYTLISQEYVLEFLEKREHKLDGVVISGGEPTIQKDLAEFIQSVKEMGYKIKLDTNGSNPKVLEKLLQKGFLDYIAMDIKAPLKKYKTVTNSNINTELIIQSMKLIKNSGVNFEYRTTAVPCLHSVDDFYEIKTMFEEYGFPMHYYIQNFSSKVTLDEKLNGQKPFNDKQNQEIVSIFKNTPCVCIIR